MKISGLKLVVPVESLDERTVRGLPGRVQRALESGELPPEGRFGIDDLPPFAGRGTVGNHGTPDLNCWPILLA